MGRYLAACRSWNSHARPPATGNACGRSGLLTLRTAQHKKIIMGAPSPELVDLWLARAFNALEVEAAAAMYHPEASVVRLEQVHGSTIVARGADDIRATMAGYIGLKPHMDVVVHHTTVSGDFALCRSQWRITGTDQDGKPLEVHHHGTEVMRRLPNGEWVFFIDHLWGADSSWAVDRPPVLGDARDKLAPDSPRPLPGQS